MWQVLYQSTPIGDCKAVDKLEKDTVPTLEEAFDLARTKHFVHRDMLKDDGKGGFDWYEQDVEIEEYRDFGGIRQKAYGSHEYVSITPIVPS